MRHEKEMYFLDKLNSLTRVTFLFYGASQGRRGVRNKCSANRHAPAPCFLSGPKDDLRMNEQWHVSRTLAQVQTRLKKSSSVIVYRVQRKWKLHNVWLFAAVTFYDLDIILNECAKFRELLIKSTIMAVFNTLGPKREWSVYTACLSSAESLNFPLR